MNKAVLDLISQDYEIAHRMYFHLREKFPQLNERTKIAIVNTPTIRIACAPFERHAWTDDMIDVPISGRKRLMQQLFPSTRITNNLDHPELRWQYTTRLFSAIVRLPYYRLMRVAGRLFKRARWTAKGMEHTLNPRAVLPRVSYDEVVLERFGVQTSNALAWKSDPVVTMFICGYYAPTDTLYVYRR